MLQLEGAGFLTIRREIPGYGTPLTLSFGQYANMLCLQKMRLSVIEYCSQETKLGVGYAQWRNQMNSYHAAGATRGYIGDAPTQLRVEEHVLHIFMLRIH